MPLILHVMVAQETSSSQELMGYALLPSSRSFNSHKMADDLNQMNLTEQFAYQIPQQPG